MESGPALLNRVLRANAVAGRQLGDKALSAAQEHR
jgi:hypothetical protein